MSRIWILCVGCLALSSFVAEAQVKVERRADGVFVLSNNPDRAPAPARPGPLAGRARGGARFAVPANLQYRIVNHARRQRLDPRLVEALIRVESGFDSKAVSRKGAIGLMQLMPQTAAQLGVRNAFDIEENLRGGTAYLRQLLDRFQGDVRLALAGYNAGPGAVERHRGVPPFEETTEYIRRVMAAYRGLSGGR